MESRSRWIILVAAAWLTWPPAQAQDMMRHVDLSSRRFSTAEMTRAEVEASLRAAASIPPYRAFSSSTAQRLSPRRSERLSDAVGNCAIHARECGHAAGLKQYHHERQHIFYKDWGKGRPGVFSYCWPLSADAWDGQMMALGSAGYRVVAHDRRSHGRWDQTWDNNTMDQYVSDYAELLEHLT